MAFRLYTKKDFQPNSLIAIAFVLMLLSGCKKLVEVDPPINRTTGESVYLLDNTAISAVTGIYTNMISGGSFISGAGGISLFSGLSGDELTLFNGVPVTDVKTYYYTNTLYVTTNATTPGTEFWTNLYNYINKCNSAIEGLESSSSLTLAVQRQLLGEAKFLRGLCFFYLLNLYGDVPLALTTDYAKNSKLPRSDEAEVYAQIIEDLNEAKDLLSANYLDGNLLNTTIERVRPTKWAASALLARVYLYIHEWAKAEEQSISIINNASLYNLDTLNGVFLKNSKEAIWQLQPNQIGYNTEDGRTFIIPPTGPNNNFKGQPAYLSSSLLNSFEVNDQRKSKWTNSITTSGGIAYNFSYKYKRSVNDTSINVNTGTTNMKEYFMVLRLGEQYLIRAEARARQGNLVAAINDLDKIRGRANLSLVGITNPSISETDLLNAILHERQVEMFTELGQRWFDLKRTGTIDAIMTSAALLKESVWNSYQQLYPLPLYDILKNPRLSQNTGY